MKKTISALFITVLVLAGCGKTAEPPVPPAEISSIVTVGTGYEKRGKDVYETVNLYLPDPLNEKENQLYEYLKFKKIKQGLPFHLGVLENGRLNTTASISNEDGEKIVNAINTKEELELEFKFPPPPKDGFGVPASYTKACSITAEIGSAGEIKTVPPFSSNLKYGRNFSCVLNSGDEEIVKKPFYVQNENGVTVGNPIGTVKVKGIIITSVEDWFGVQETVKFVLANPPADGPGGRFYEYLESSALSVRLPIRIGVLKNGQINTTALMSSPSQKNILDMLNKNKEVSVKLKFLKSTENGTASSDINYTEVSEIEAVQLPPSLPANDLQFPPPPVPF